MNVWAKVLAVLVLIGSALGVTSQVFVLVTYARQGVLDQLGAGAAVLLGQMALSFFFTVCAIVLAIMVLASRQRTV